MTHRLLLEKDYRPVTLMANPAGEGYEAASAGEPVTANPYAPDTPASHDWRDGWEQGRQLSKEKPGRRML